MDKHRCLKLALRIDAGLKATLGAGIDAKRMVAEPLYARDVLLVCDALVGDELPALAGAFRQAAAPETVNPLLRAPLSIARLLGALFRPAEPQSRPRTDRQSRQGRPRREPASDAASRNGTPADRG